MCRLLFLLNVTNKQKYLLTFLEQSIHTQKNTPYINNDYEKIQHLDGFGVACLGSNKKWTIYKNSVVYHQDEQLERKIKSLCVTHTGENDKSSNIIIGHIRSKTTGDKKIENTHPFMYKNQLFCHNGELFDFHKHKKKIIEKINPRFLKNIQGDTDSEHLFYLLLTCKEQMLKDKGTDISTENQYILDVFELFFSIIRDLDMFLLANIIYSTSEYTVITRYIIKNKNQSICPPSLYYDESDGLIISSEPITKNYKVVKENSILFVPHYKKNS